MKLKVNDLVIVIAGKDKGKTGKIIKINKIKRRVLVEGINKKIKHSKGQNGEPGKRIEIFAPLDISNVAILDPKTKKASKVGYSISGSAKIRIAKKSQSPLTKEIMTKNIKDQKKKKTKSKSKDSKKQPKKSSK